MRTAVAFLALLLAGAPCRAAGDLESRVVQVQMLDSKGKPAPNVPVDLYGLERDARAPQDSVDKGEPPAPGWHFTSDAAGRFTVRLGKNSGYHHDFQPGYGEFFLVAEKPGTAGAVSPCLWNAAPHDSHSPAESGNEWTKGRTLRLRDGLNKLTLAFRPGVTVTGRLVDGYGAPVAGGTVSCEQNLHYGSHTGYGGEFFQRQATVDEQGRFVFSHVFPNTFSLSLDERGCWTRTRIGRRWYGDPVREIAVRPGQREVKLRLVVGPPQPYVFTGSVTDADGAPAAAAQVKIGLSAHREPATYGDSHHFEETTADAAGRFILHTDRKFATWIQAAAPGAGQMHRDFDETKLASPGRYDLRLSLTPDLDHVY